MEMKTDINVSEALKGNELINGMNTFIDHIHHITLENKKLKEQLKKENDVGDDITQIGICYREENKKLKEHIKEQQQVFQNEKDELLAELSHSHYYYGQLKEKAQKWESLCDQCKTQLDKTQDMLTKTFGEKEFYEKMFIELRSTLAQSQNHSYNIH